MNALLGIGAVFFALLLYGFFKPRPNPVAALQAEYVALMRLGRQRGLRELAQRIEALSERFPGKSDLWYLQWLVDDLRRAKR